MTPSLSTPRGSLIREWLVADHARLERLFDRLLEAFAADAREDTQALWRQLDDGVTAHFELEEQLLFPRFILVAPREVAALREQHRQLREQLAELGAAVDLKLVKADVARAFIDGLRAHARREDDMLYEWASMQATQRTARSLLDRLQSDRPRPRHH